MARAQCPECGRFLSGAFVEGLAVESTPCPKCETLLTASHFDLDGPGADARPDGADEEPAGAAALREEQPDLPESTRDPVAAAAPTSVRPPDLDPTDVRDDVLADWDRPGADVLDLAARRTDTSAPPDAAVVAGAGAAGLLLGALLSDRRTRGGLLGLLLGVVAAAAARRVWVLDDQG